MSFRTLVLQEKVIQQLCISTHLEMKFEINQSIQPVPYINHSDHFFIQSSIYSTSNHPKCLQYIFVFCTKGTWQAY